MRYRSLPCHFGFTTFQYAYAIKYRLLRKSHITVNLITILENSNYLNVKPYQKLAANKPACLVHKISLAGSNHVAMIGKVEPRERANNEL